MSPAHPAPRVSSPILPGCPLHERTSSNGEAAVVVRKGPKQVRRPGIGCRISTNAAWRPFLSISATSRIGLKVRPWGRGVLDPDLTRSGPAPRNQPKEQTDQRCPVLCPRGPKRQDHVWCKRPKPRPAARRVAPSRGVFALPFLAARVVGRRGRSDHREKETQLGAKGIGGFWPRGPGFFFFRSQIMRTETSRRCWSP